MPGNMIDHLRAELAQARIARRVGRIGSIGSGRIAVSGVASVAALGDRVEFPAPGRPSLWGEIIELDGATRRGAPRGTDGRVPHR